MTIKNYIDKFLFLRVTFLVLRYIITCINVIIGCFILSVLIDKILPLPMVVFHVYWFIILAILVVFFINLVIRLIQVFYNPILQLQKILFEEGLLLNNDDLINAYQLERKLIQPQVLNFSEQLAISFVENIKNKLSRIDFLRFSGFINLYKVLPLNFVLIVVVFILYTLPPYIIKSSIYKIVFTRKPEILGIFISPKNAKVQFGESCEIKVIVDKEYSIYTPDLLIKSATMKKFNKVKFEKTTDFVGRKIYRYKISSVDEVIIYKVKFRGITSRQYTIEPVIPPRISYLNIKVLPPQYTGQKEFNIQNFSETKYLYGSKVYFTGNTNKTINEIYIHLYGKKIKLDIRPDGKTFYGSFVVTQNTELWFELVDVEGIKNEEIIKYRIEMIEDLPPQIQIISPAVDIIVDQNAVIPLVYSVKDDFGISKVELVYEVDKKIDRTIKLVKNYSYSITEDINEYQFDLAKLKLDFGDVVKYRMIVYDNDSLHGHKCDVTNEYKIEIFNYEKRHQLIQQQVEKFIDKATQLLSEEIKLYDTILSLTTDYTVGFDKLISQSQNKISEYKDLETLLEDIISQMSIDPYTSVDTLMEFKGLQQSVQNLYSNLGPARTESLKQNNISLTQNIQEQIIDTLQRASMLTKDIIKRQNMENINKLASQNINAAKELMEMLQNLSTDLSEEDKLKITNLLLQIEDKLKKIQDKLMMLKKELPEEFINRREIQNLDFVTPMDIIESILELIKKDDIKSAIGLAEKLLKHLDLFMNSISSAANEYLNSEMSNLNSQINNVITKLDKIITIQQDIYHKSKEVDEVRIRETEKFQEKQLIILEQKCRNIEQLAKDIVCYLDTVDSFQNKEVYKLNLSMLYNRIKSIKDEIKNKRLIQSLKYIEESLSIWQQNVKISSAVQQDFSILFSSTVSIMQNLDEISEILQTEPAIVYPPKVELKRLKAYNEQLSLNSEMDSFIADLKTLAKKSFVINSEDISLASSARAEMKASAEALNKIFIPKALQHQNIALNLLLKLKDNFLSKQEQLQQIMQQLSQPIAGNVQTRSLPGGKIGVLTAPVELPSVKDYRPPKELREEIIKSLSEKYPEELRYTIEQYYKEVLR